MELQKIDFSLWKAVVKRLSKKNPICLFIHRVHKRKQNQGFRRNHSTVIITIQRLVQIPNSNNFPLGITSPSVQRLPIRCKRLLTGIFEEN